HAYDGFYRLATAETQGPHWGLSFSYDRYGNRLSQSATKGSPPTHSATVDAYSNRMTAWSYDEAGNVLGDTRHSYAFDANNKIVSMDSGTATYAYDAQGSRVKKTVGGAITYYFWGHEYVSGWSKFHIFLGGRKLAEYSGGTTRFFHLNHLGTPMARTNMSGAQDASWTHYPLGEEWTSSEPSDDQHRFSGHMRDSESGNEYAGARYLSSEGGRWLGVDSVRGASDLPQTLNRFAYALDDPINFIDRDGNQPVVGQTVCTVTVTGEWDGGHFIVHGYWGSCDSYFARERGYGGGGFGGPGAGGHGGRPSNGSGQVDAHMIRNKQIRKSIEDFLKEHSDCATIVAGFDTKWQTKVASVQFYDVRSESIWSELALQLVAHGLQTSKGNPWGGTLGDYFARRPEGTIATVVTGYRNGQPSTEPLVLLGARYFDADYLKKHELTKDAIATHEFLHVITGLTDPELAKRLKLEFKKGEASKAIQRFIQDGCPKEE
ncbi:MAG TPA: RHS repeat-associated core domain-containing protein, partial [Acidobacteriota bacterium]|nr:RHS repeat-associated core domain-containing protein [Acidobacteriota bacterium]